jgi:hypothetical protein
MLTIRDAYSFLHIIFHNSHHLFHFFFLCSWCFFASNKEYFSLFISRAGSCRNKGLGSSSALGLGRTGPHDNAQLRRKKARRTERRMEWIWINGTTTCSPWRSFAWRHSIRLLITDGS